MRLRPWVCSLACAAAVSCAGCGPSRAVQTDGAELGVEALDGRLRPGLVRLLPYAFGTADADAGLRWLENVALAQRGTPVGHRASYWLLRARLDWLTHAYAEDALDRRVALLEGLLEHLSIEREGDNDAIDARVRRAVARLEAQAERLGQAPRYSAFADSATRFARVFLELGLTAGHAASLRACLPEAPLDGVPDPLGPWALAPNALLVATTDAKAFASQIEALTPERRPHALAMVSAYACPEGLMAFAEAPLEQREAALRAGCAWPCPSGAEAQTRAEVVRACGAGLTVGAEAFSVPNEVTGQAVRELALLERHSAVLVAQEGDAIARHPVLAAYAPRLKTGLAWVKRRPFVLDVPAYRGALDGGVTLPSASYADAPSLAPWWLRVDASGLRVTLPPMLRVADDGQTALAWTDATSAWTYPGAQVEGAGQALDGGDTARLGQALEPALKGAEEAFAARLGASMEGLAPGAVVPLVLIDRSAPAPRLKTLAEALRRRGHRALDVAVYDAELKRAGAVRLVLGAPQAQGERLEVSASALTWERAAGAKRATLKHPSQDTAQDDVDIAGLQAALRSVERERLVMLGVRVRGDVRVGRLIAALDAARYWRRLEPKPGSRVQIATAILEQRGAARVLVERFVLLADADE